MFRLTKHTVFLLSFILICFLLTACTRTSKNVKNNLKWWQNTVVYEIYPNSFKDSDGDGYGDLQGIISELDHLQSLGVGAIWLTPIYASPMDDNGYDVSNYYEINPRYGTMDDMDQLIKEAKDRNIRIVMDLVFNHTSIESEWFKESSNNKTNAKSDWYIWRDPNPDGSAPNNWRGIFGGSAWTYCSQRNQYYLHTFGDFQPDLNWENTEVRNALYDIANFWVDKGVGGFRVDAITYIKKPKELKDGPIDGPDKMSSIHPMISNTPGILDFLHEFKDNVQVGKDIFVVGEANGVPANELTDWVGENGVFDMIFEFSHVNVQFSEGEVWHNTKDWKLTELKKALSDSQNATKDTGWCPVFFENHDQPRSVEHFLPNCTDYKTGAKLIGMMMMTLRGTPFMYEGQEIGMTNIGWDDIKQYNDLSSHNQYEMAISNGYHKNEAIAFVQKFSRDNARTPMQWSDDDHAGFTTGTPWLPEHSNYKEINVKAENEDPDSVLNWYYKLKELRAFHTALIYGDYNELFHDNEKIYAYSRKDDKEKLVILLNFSSDTVTVDETAFDNPRVLLSSTGNNSCSTLKPYEAMCIIVD